MLNRPGHAKYAVNIGLSIAPAQGLRRSLIIAAVTLIISAGLLNKAQAQANAYPLDPTFGNDGKVTTSFINSISSAGQGITQQPDGKLVVVGYAFIARANFTGDRDFAIARYNINGSLDTSFGRGGRVLTDFFGGNDGSGGVAVQPDGKIIVVGSASGSNNMSTDFAVARYLSNGTLDNSFGSGGRVVTDMHSIYDGAADVALLPNGKIVVAGVRLSDPTSDDDFAVVRYNSNGSIDHSFGDNGMVFTDILLNHSDRTVDMALQPDGKIVVLGTSNIFDLASSDFALARYNADGSPDTTFDDDGKLITDLFGAYDRAFAIALQPDGKIVVGGATKNPALGQGPGLTSDFALVRYNKDGQLDTTFGDGGKLATDFFNSGDLIGGLTVQPDGKIIAVGAAGLRYLNQNFSYFAVARYNPDGSLDTTFSNNGKHAIKFNGSALADAVIVQPDGKFVAAGYASRFGGGDDFALARYPGAAALTSLTLSQSVVNGGQSLTGTVTIGGPAPAGGVVVTLTDTLSAAAMPLRITINAGETSKSFTIRTRSIGHNQPGKVRATIGAIILTAPLTVQP